MKVNFPPEPKVPTDPKRGDILWVASRISGRRYVVLVGTNEMLTIIGADDDLISNVGVAVNMGSYQILRRYPNAVIELGGAE